ncbi:MAG: pilus assembly protein [Anaerolineae bacterium]
MTTHMATGPNMRQRKGQTLAEFAITLPIVLTLVFGVIEFGRIFQAWVSLQNAARTAVRYASTYQYDTELFPMNLSGLGNNPSDPAGLIPCVDDGPGGTYTYSGPGTDARGVKATIQPNGPGNPSVTIYTQGLESLFATWNDGKNCDPRDQLDQGKRRDMARLLSIMLEARRGAAGLAIETNKYGTPASNIVTTANWDQFPWFQVWKGISASVPPPGSSDRTWFDVKVCSDTRGVNYGDLASGYYKVQASDGLFYPNSQNRFVQYLGGDTLQDGSNNLVHPWAPSCMLNERPPTGSDPTLIDNSGTPWLDPGNQADTVTVIITFNHPLITPLPLARYVQLQARRSAIVESFRPPGNLVSAIVGPPIAPDAPTPTPTNTATSNVPNTPEPTATLTPTGSSTPTNTPVPDFTCSLLSVTNPRIQGSQYRVDIQNNNVQDTYLTRVQVTWPTISASQMALEELTLNGAVNWLENTIKIPQAGAVGATNNSDTDITPSGAIPFSSYAQSVREILGESGAAWAATFTVANLSAYTSVVRFGATFTLFNPRTPATPCVITLTVPTATPTNTPVGVPTNTPTPDCTPSQIKIEWDRFENFGIVRFRVLNFRTVPSTVTGFTLNWRNATNLVLRNASFVAAPGGAGSVVVWTSSGPTQDSATPTTSGTEGTWLTNFTLDAGSPTNPSITYFYADFDGYNRVEDAGHNSSTYNGSQFNITCGNGAPGPVPVNTFPPPTNTPPPAPTNTPGPTNTPRPTNTATRTPTVGPPPPTSTPRPPTATPPPNPTATNAPPPTLGGGGCTDNCG